MTFFPWGVGNSSTNDKSQKDMLAFYYPAEDQREIPAGLSALVHPGFIFHLWKLSACKHTQCHYGDSETDTRIWKEHKAKSLLWCFVRRGRKPLKAFKTTLFYPLLFKQEQLPQLSLVFCFIQGSELKLWEIWRRHSRDEQSFTSLNPPLKCFACCQVGKRQQWM